MSRITKKCKDGSYQLKAGNEIYGEENGIRLVQIVGQVEDLKEELGMSLVVFHKLMTAIYKDEKVYFKTRHGVNEVSLLGIDYGKRTVYFCVLNGSFKEYTSTFNGYGINWAFTKEELL